MFAGRHTQSFIKVKQYFYSTAGVLTCASVDIDMIYNNQLKRGEKRLVEEEGCEVQVFQLKLGTVFANNSYRQRWQ